MPAPNPKDSMRSTWRTASRDTWSIHHWAIDLLGAHPVALDKEVPVFDAGSKLPYMPQWSLQRWVLFYAAIPLALQQAWAMATGRNLSGFAVFNLYFFAINANVIYQVHVLRRLAHVYGFLDGQHARDGVPDVGVSKVVHSLYKTTGSRLALSVWLCYRQAQLPAQLDWAWLPLQIGVYGIVLDFWFYWYHRLMHDVPWLWRFHRTHHLTKHPNPLLAAYADHEQEFGDMVAVPMMTFFTLRAIGLPLGFYEWWICQQYVVFAEVFGHSGLRVHTSVPSTLNWLLTMLGAEIVVEDHDLHHRKGWRKSHNYGKQTRLWDRIFGTCGDRIEAVEENVDYENVVPMPLW